jgi:hypothetical protein
MCVCVCVRACARVCVCVNAEQLSGMYVCMYVRTFAWTTHNEVIKSNVSDFRPLLRVQFGAESVYTVAWIITDSELPHFYRSV